MTVAARQPVLDEVAVRAWAAGALTACHAARERIDAVNVFPVPDADTGSNVTLTVAGGADAVAAVPDGTGPTELVTVLAQGAARAARGNSGIILSQWLVGFATALRDGVRDDEPVDDVVVLVEALRRADRAARDAVPDPQEGTVLTVAREVAEHARRTVAALLPSAASAVVGSGWSAAAVLADATDAARADLARMSAGHDVLRAAHVVDAGACALLVVLDALVHTLRTGRAQEVADVDVSWLPQADPDVVAGCGPAAGGAFEVMMLVRTSWAGGAGLAESLQAVGDAVAVVDAGPSRHAHVHCDDPAAAIDLVPAEAREQVVVRRVDEPAPADRGLVVLTRSPGLAAWYATCGAVTLVGAEVDGGQVARAAVDTRAVRAVVVDAGVGLPADPGTTEAFDVLQASGDGAAVVACLALVADPHVAPTAGEHALRRLRTATATSSASGAAEVGVLVDRLLPGVPEAQGVTVLHNPEVRPGAARAVADAVAAAHPHLEVVVAGPAAGPAWWVGVD